MSISKKTIAVNIVQTDLVHIGGDKFAEVLDKKNSRYKDGRGYPLIELELGGRNDNYTIIVPATLPMQKLVQTGPATLHEALNPKPKHEPLQAGEDRA